MLEVADASPMLAASPVLSSNPVATFFFMMISFSGPMPGGNNLSAS